jgi:hypothetical protein
VGTGRLYTSTNISVTPCLFVCNRDRLPKTAKEKIANLARQLLAMPKKGNLLARQAATAEAQEALVLTPGYSAHMRNVAYVQSIAKGATAADHVETNPADGVALQMLKEAHPDVDQALQNIQKAHQVTKGLVDSYCRKQIDKLLKEAAAKKEAAKKEAAEATAKEGAAQEAAPQGENKNERERKKGTRRSQRSSTTEVEEAPQKLIKEAVVSTSLASELIKQAAAKKAATAALKEAAKVEGAKEEAPKRKRKRHKPNQPIKKADKPAKHRQKTAEVVRDEKIEANILSWLDTFMNAHAKPKDKNIAALAALELKRMPKNKTQVDAACRRASKKYHPDKIPADFSDSKRELYTEAFKGLVQVKELVMNKINK